MGKFAISPLLSAMVIVGISTGSVFRWRVAEAAASDVPNKSEEKPTLKEEAEQREAREAQEEAESLAETQSLNERLGGKQPAEYAGMTIPESYKENEMEEASYSHKLFFLRVAMGTSWMFGSGPEDYQQRGFGTSFGIYAGASLLPGMIVHGSYWFDYLLASTSTFSGAEAAGTDGTGNLLMSYGAGLTGYFGDNYFAGVSLGIGLTRGPVWNVEEDGSITVIGTQRSKIGPSGELQFGWEGWIAPFVGLGVSFRYALLLTPQAADTLHNADLSQSFGLRMTFTYN